jgi:hypothetical protein
MRDGTKRRADQDRATRGAGQHSGPRRFTNADRARAIASRTQSASGCELQIDDATSLDLAIQTCENRGCYASTPLTPDIVSALKVGKQLKILFQDLAKETMAISMPLNDFSAAYDKIR